MPDKLLLIPTPLEMEIAKPLLADSDWALDLCGFGPIASASRTSQLIAEHRPAKVILAGIAGRYGNSIPVGGAARFSSVSCYGIGVGSGADFQSAGELGWKQWDGDNEHDPISDNLCLDSCGSPLLLTVTSAAASQLDVELRRQRFPSAVAEDMEGFGVAVACRLAEVSLTIVRGISNDAGNRDHEVWEIEEAMQAAVALINETESTVS